MQLKTLTLAALGLLLVSHDKLVYAKPAVLDDVAVADGRFSESYLSVFSSEDDEEVEFELSDESSTSILQKRAESCSKYHTVSGKDSCATMAKKYGVTISNIYDWNPQIRSGCPNLNNGKKYCVSLGSKSSKKSSKKSSNNNNNNSGCAKTHRATGSDTCVKLAKKFGLSLNEFYALNPSVNKSCSNLHTGKQYCMKGGKSSSKKTTKKVIKKTTKATTKTTKKAVTTTKKAVTTTKAAAKKVAVKAATKDDESDDSKEIRKKLQTGSEFTYYWIAQQDDYSGGKKVTVKTCKGESIGTVTESFADALVMEGSGLVGSKVINLGDCDCTGYKCFELLDKKTDPYGLTSYGTSLRPYITIASNDFPRDTKIFVPAIVGWNIPGTNMKHNGCLLVDDESWSFGGRHIDFYVYSMDNYETLDKTHRLTSVDIYEGGSCKLLNYSV